MKVLISLVGDQPAPNVLPVRHYAPDKVVLVHTQRTEPLAGRIAAVIQDSYPVQEPFCKVHPYLIQEIRTELSKYFSQNQLHQEELIFNLTGGTKTMGYAALELARRCNAVAFYYQTEENQSLIHPYHFEEDRLVVDSPVQIQRSLTLQDHLRLYVNDIQITGKFNDAFEENVYETLKASGIPDFEVMPSMRLTGVNSTVEVDLVARMGNQIAVFEVKRRAGKAGIDQLNSATHPLMLGTYTKKVMVTSFLKGDNNHALAQAYKVEVIILESGNGDKLSDIDKEKLIVRIRSILEPRK